MITSRPLLPKYFVPTVDSRVLRRDRLHLKLDRVSDAAVILVTAMSGLGKTTLVAEWASQRARPVAWYSLGEGDTTYAAFMAGLFQAVRPFLLPLPLAYSDDPGSDAAAFAAAVAQGSERFTLVLDDAHLLEDADILAFFNDLFRQLPNTLHIVCVALTAPAFDLYPLRKHGRVAEITGHDLAFSDDEARQFLLAWVGDTFTDETIDAIVRHSAGWIACIKVLTHALPQPTATETMVSDASSAPAVLDTLLDDLIDRWPPETRRMLTAAAIPDRISANLIAALVDAGTADTAAAMLLRDISRSGQFLQPLDGVGGWYQLHDLLRQRLLLRIETGREQIDPMAVHRHAAGWFLQHGDIDDALRHAIAAGDLHGAAAMVSSHAHHTLLQDDWLTVDRWLAQLPPDLIANDIDLLLARCWVLQAHGQHHALMGTISQAREVLDRLPCPAATPRDQALAELDFLETFTTPDPVPGSGLAERYERAFTALRNTQRMGEMASIQYHLMTLSARDTQAAIGLIETLMRENRHRDDAFSQFRVLWTSIAQFLISGAEATAWELLDSSRTILLLATRLGARRQIAFADLLVASALIEFDELDEAARHFRAVLTNPFAGVRVRVGAETRLARLLDTMGQEQAADRMLRESMERLLAVDAVAFVPIVRTAELRLAIKRGHHDRAAQLVWSLGEETNPHYAASMEMPLLAQALWFAQGDSEQDGATADRILAQLQADASRVHWLAAHIQIRTILALRHFRQGQRAAAFAVLEETVRLAERTGFRRVFSEFGPRVETMLVEFVNDSDPWPFLEETVKRLIQTRSQRSPLASSGATATSLNQGFFEPLTTREIDVLTLLELRLTNKEIAFELSISPLTVKSHTRNIYGKLGVSSRRQAIAIARELGYVTR